MAKTPTIFSVQLNRAKTDGSLKRPPGRPAVAPELPSRTAKKASAGLNHDGVTRSLEFMALHYTRPIQLRDVVTASGMSRRGFIKAFVQHVGRSPGSFMRAARIEFAKRLLIEQDLPLKTIAAIVGFRSENTFCIAFNRATGLAPKKFQRQAWLAVYRNARLPQDSLLSQKITIS